VHDPEAAAAALAAAEAGLPPDPQPIDVTVKPQTRAVIITGGAAGGQGRQGTAGRGNGPFLPATSLPSSMRILDWPPHVPLSPSCHAPAPLPPLAGPNTGGKTASLKALGLAAVAAKCGLPLPADAPARLPCFDAVLADIGDEQSLSASLSTFSGHLRRISALRMESGSRSLVLLDEVGTGGCCGTGCALCCRWGRLRGRH
jgi:hypothetical protein